MDSWDSNYNDKPCESDEFWCRSNGTCLNFGRVCDSINDCADGDDENRACITTCRNHGCNQVCSEKSKGPECSCSEGFQNGADNGTCLDIYDDDGTILHPYALDRRILKLVRSWIGFNSDWVADIDVNIARNKILLAQGHDNDNMLIERDLDTFNKQSAFRAPSARGIAHD